MGVQNGPATLEINLAVPYIDKHTLAILYHTYNPEMPLFLFIQIKAYVNTKTYTQMLIEI